MLLIGFFDTIKKAFFFSNNFEENQSFISIKWKKIEQKRYEGFLQIKKKELLLASPVIET